MFDAKTEVKVVCWQWLYAGLTDEHNISKSIKKDIILKKKITQEIDSFHFFSTKKEVQPTYSSFLVRVDVVESAFETWSSD